MQANFSSHSSTRLRSLFWLPLLLALAGCDQLGIETPAIVAAKKEAEGRAIGSACRHAVRSIEDCYRNNPKSPKAAIFDGWREMDGYMRENDIQGMPYQPTPEPATEPAQDHAPAAQQRPAGAVPAAANGNGRPGQASTAPTGGIPLIQGLPQRPNIAPSK